MTPEAQSLMPAYGRERLSDTDLDNLVRYLRTLKGRTATTPRQEAR